MRKQPCLFPPQRCGRSDCCCQYYTCIPMSQSVIDGLHCISPWLCPINSTDCRQVMAINRFCMSTHNLPILKLYAMLWFYSSIVCESGALVRIRRTYSDPVKYLALTISKYQINLVKLTIVFRRSQQLREEGGNPPHHPIQPCSELARYLTGSLYSYVSNRLIVKSILRTVGMSWLSTDVAFQLIIYQF